MLHDFLFLNRELLIARCRDKVASRSSPKVTEDELDHGVPFFLDQLTRTLRLEQKLLMQESQKVSGTSGGGDGGEHSELGDTAAQHGGELLRRGYTVEQVVRDYGDLCQAITEMALELNEPMAVDEFRTLNRCLDNAIAMAVTEYNHQRDLVLDDKRSAMLNFQVGAFVHEVHNYLYTASLALCAIREGKLGLYGATGTVLDRALSGMQALVDRSMNEIRLKSKTGPFHGLFGLADFINELRLSGELEAHDKKCFLVVSVVDPLLALDGDRNLLLAAMGNLLQNAFKFTHPGTNVNLKAYAQHDRILVDVEDHGEGMSLEMVGKLFQPYAQGGADRSGLGLGLSIARQSVAANRGILSVRNKSGSGWVFTIDLPKHVLAEASA